LIQTIDSLANALVGTPLEGHSIREMWTCSTVDSIFVIDIDGNHTEDDFAFLSSLMKLTGRQPAISNPDYVEMTLLSYPPSDSLTTDGDWIANKSAEALLVYEAQYGSYGGTLNASNLIKTKEKYLFDWLDIALDHWSHPLGEILKRFGEAPTVHEIRHLHEAGVLRTDAELERWLFDWEIKRFGDAALAPQSVEYLNGFEFDGGFANVAVLLPTELPWKTLLYMGWDGCEHSVAEKSAALRSWNERYGAEIVGSFITTLHLKVKRRPQNVDEAFTLALEHYNFASDTLVLPGISIREHARALLSMDHWFFHSKP
jgi:hypothetical protein